MDDTVNGVVVKKIPYRLLISQIDVCKGGCDSGNGNDAVQNRNRRIGQIVDDHNFVPFISLMFSLPLRPLWPWATWSSSTWSPSSFRWYGVSCVRTRSCISQSQSRLLIVSSSFFAVDLRFAEPSLESKSNWSSILFDYPYYRTYAFIFISLLNCYLTYLISCNACRSVNFLSTYRFISSSYYCVIWCTLKFLDIVWSASLTL